MRSHAGMAKQRRGRRLALPYAERKSTPLVSPLAGWLVVLRSVDRQMRPTAGLETSSS
jgi:hypothetical protein